MEKEVTFKINSCTKCPHYICERDYTSDSFELCFRWICPHNNKKDIRRYVEWIDNKKFIPDWCPLIDKINISSKFSCDY